MHEKISKAICYAGLGIAIVSMVFGLFLVKRQNVYAGTYDNAYSFYSTYGNRMCFVAATETDGNIYYATRAKRTSSNILFSNIGWKATIYNGSGAVLQKVYYKLGGNYLKTTDIRTAEDGYEYSLYAVSLNDFKSRLNESALEALESGNCDIEFDACIIIKRNSVPSGWMTDDGISGSGVYTTYEGIVNAEQWSTTTTSSLLSYYDKEVEGLFYTLNLNKDSGIESVSGAGRYCYGTTVTISATPLSGYHFSHWSGEAELLAAQSDITITKTMTYTACSEGMDLKIWYFRNTSNMDFKHEIQVIYYGVEGQKLTDFKWKRIGYYQTGWKIKKTGLGADYYIDQEVNDAWIIEHAPELKLYANWSPNRYTVVFDKNMGWTDDNNESQIMLEKAVNYQENLTMPECETNATLPAFLGWSTEADALLPEYYVQDEVAVSTLAKAVGVKYSDGAQIVLYAVWDQMPAITAEDIYVSLQSAQEGNVTEDWLYMHARATDKEDGSILPGIHESNYFVLQGYDAEKYTQAKGEGTVLETFSVKDSSGNICNRTIKVHLVDTTIHLEQESEGNIRFISMEYFMDENGGLLSREEGGLEEDSVWRCEEAFLTLLREVLSAVP